MSTTEPTNEPTSLEALVGRLQALSIMLHDLYPNSHYPDDLDEAIHLLSEAGQSIAALAVAPAPSDDDREAIEQIIEDTASVRSGVDDYEVDNADEISGKILSYLARRSPVSPPEDVTALLEAIDADIRNIESWPAPSEEIAVQYAGVRDGLIRAREIIDAAALRAPVPVETGALRSFVEDLAGHGVRFDLNPTVDSRRGSFAYLDYLARIDQSVRERAAEALRPTREIGRAHV